MKNKSAILVATERISYLSRECPDDESIDGYWIMLESLRTAVDHLKNFRRRVYISSAHSRDRDSAIGTPDTFTRDNVNTRVETQVSRQCVNVQKVFQDAVTLTIEEGKDLSLPHDGLDNLDVSGYSIGKWCPPLPDFDGSGSDELFTNDKLMCGSDFLNGPDSHGATALSVSEFFDYNAYIANMEEQIQEQYEPQAEDQDEGQEKDQEEQLEKDQEE